MAPRRAIARMFEADLSAPVVNAGLRTSNPRELSERVAMGRALWRELVVGFASQLGGLRLGFTQLAALYVLADGGVTTISDLADTLGRSPSATSRLVDGLVRRRLVERRPEAEDRRQKTLWLTQRGKALLRVVDRAYLIHNGEVVYEGVAEQLVNDPKAREIYLGPEFNL